MSKIKSVLKAPNIITGYLYFYIHFVVEVLCFFVLARLIGDSSFLWMAPLLYDAIAFVPQAVIGYVSDKFPKLKIGFLGTVFLIVGFICFGLNVVSSYLSIAILSLGNAFLHVDGAEVTLRTSKGKLSHSAIFVSGGSFGVITGKLLGTSNLSFWILVVLGLSIIPFIILANMYRSDMDSEDKNLEFDYANPKISGGYVILLAVFVVIVRGYMGYGLPTSWNKTIIQTIMLYCAMGLGKALGGILADVYGVKRIGILSSLLALPFLLFGDNLMLVSLIGVLLFSMTMSITLALIVSILKKTPGLAFGMTTIGLFLGSLPIFFFRITSTLVNCIVIVLFTILCVVIFKYIIRKDDIHEQYKMDI